MGMIIRPETAEVICRIGLEGREIPTLTLGPVKNGKIGGVDVSEDDCAVEMSENGNILLETEDVDTASIFGLKSGQSIPSPTTKLALESGTLTADNAYLEGSGFDSRGPWSRYRLFDWSWSLGRTPVVWVGVLPSGTDLPPGNLCIVRGRHFMRGGLALEHAGYQWFVVPTKRNIKARVNVRGAVVVLDTNGQDVDVERVRRGLRALSFVLGRPLRMSVLVGMDEDLGLVQARSVGFGMRRVGHRTHSPLLETNNPTEQWHISFLEKLVEKIEADPENDVSFLAAESYIDSLCTHMDGSYLAAHIALEAFCGAALKQKGIGSGPSSLVIDSGEWKGWIDSQRGEVEKHAGSPDALDRLMKKLVSAEQGSSSDTVANYFKHYGITLTKNKQREIAKERGVMAHTLLMSKPGKRDVGKDLERLRDVQALLAAALALHVDYRGPLAKGGDVSSWWPHQNATSPAISMVQCERPVPTGPPQVY